MQDNEFRHKEHARVRSADAAVFKAVEHEAALERKAERQGHRAKPKHTGAKPRKTKRVSDSQLYGIKKRHKGRVPLIILLILVIIFGGLVYGAFYIYNRDTDYIVREQTIEAGESANLEMYIQGEPMFEDYISCNLDFNTVNYVLPQTIRFTIRMFQYPA